MYPESVGLYYMYTYYKPQWTFIDGDPALLSIKLVPFRPSLGNTIVCVTNGTDRWPFEKVQSIIGEKLNSILQRPENSKVLDGLNNILKSYYLSINDDATRHAILENLNGYWDGNMPTEIRNFSYMAFSTTLLNYRNGTKPEKLEPSPISKREAWRSIYNPIMRVAVKPLGPSSPMNWNDRVMHAAVDFFNASNLLYVLGDAYDIDVVTLEGVEQINSMIAAVTVELKRACNSGPSAIDRAIKGFNDLLDILIPDRTIEFSKHSIDIMTHAFSKLVDVTCLFPSKDSYMKIIDKLMENGTL